MRLLLLEVTLLPDGSILLAACTVVPVFTTCEYHKLWMPRKQAMQWMDNELIKCVVVNCFLEDECRPFDFLEIFFILGKVIVWSIKLTLVGPRRLLTGSRWAGPPTGPPLSIVCGQKLALCPNFSVHRSVLTSLLQMLMRSL